MSKSGGTTARLVPGKKYRYRDGIVEFGWMTSGGVLAACFYNENYNFQDVIMIVAEDLREINECPSERSLMSRLRAWIESTILRRT